VQRGYRVEFLGPEGPRSAGLKQAGVPIFNLGLDDESWLDYIRRSAPDVLHQHVPGYALPKNPIYNVWPRLTDKKPRLIETNVFGRLEDPVGEEIVSYRLFISQASAAQAFLRAGRVISPAALEKQTVVYYPVEPPRTFSSGEKAAIRGELGLGDEEVLAVRIGQPGGTKWALWECEAFARARRRASNLRLLVMEPNEWIQARIRSNEFPTGILVRHATSDFDWLARLYAAADLMIHASSWGESFGYTIAEGLAAGLPLIVRSTPWGDNAQVELVTNGVSGYVCSSVGEMARRLEQLAVDPAGRRRMGEEGRARICAMAEPQQELDVLEGAIHHALTGEEHPALTRRRQSLLEFAAVFRAREWTLSEPWAAHPLDHAAGRVYSAYRRLRTATRFALNRMKG
jgi:glycosyltransferase involved in cell wall biosynthesis